MRALLFAVCSLAATLAIDLALSLFYRIGPAEGRMHEYIAFRTALHGATFTLTALGAALGFWLSRAARLDKVHVALLGGGSGAFALSATLTGLRAGAFAAIALVLVAGSTAVAYFGTRLISGGADGE